jgi:predicted unusual protein kinase regulating ubiquinone biosynthesis (AarF/ABC1/UbiB family)
MGLAWWLAGSADAFAAPLLQGRTATTVRRMLPTPTDLNIHIDLPPSLGGLSNHLASLIVRPGVQVDPDLSLESFVTALISTPWHLGAVAAFAMSNALISFIYSPDNETDAPYEPGTSTYDPQAAAEFYKTRPLLVLKRILKLTFLTGAFNTGLLFDWLVLGKLLQDDEYTALRKAEPQRAKDALILCQQLGPTFIKLGQALSIRTDLVPEAYALELRQLQDAVPPFSSKEAYDVLRKQLGVSNLNEIFSTLSKEPVASASIGQVYRGTLASDGQDVAVKVQRPGILAEIALDLHVLRILTPIQTILQNAINGVKTTQEDIDTAVLLVDEWGRGFVAETDYRLEAENTRSFEAAMRIRGLDAVCAPTVVEDLVRDTVLVTEWVEGTRLDRDASPDVPRLCGVAINAYLTMLLDTGVLHCDPHPGNLLRTTDGRLCILDWGMTLQVPNDLQYALLEFIAHINVEDYDAIPQDFINLGFSPEGVSAERLKESGVTEGLSFAFRQLSAGGGPKKIQERVKAEFQERYGAELSDGELQQAARAEMVERMEAQLASEGVDVKGVTNIMEEMSRRNRELFALPPYVLYVARAFSTLEGIGLSIDENYAIVQECYPYLARRLFTDRSPRAKRALRAMLGLSEDGNEVDSSSAMIGVVQAAPAGKDASSQQAGALSPGKLIEMSEGFASYTAATTDVDRDGAGQNAAAAEFVKLFFDPKGSTLQEIFVDETARLGDAATRAALRAALIESPAAQAAARALRTPKDLVDRSPMSNLLPGPLKAALLDRPADLPNVLESLFALNDEDERILASAKELRDALGRRIVSSGDKNDMLRSAAARQVNDGAAMIPSTPNVNFEAVSSFLTNADSRKIVTEQLPGAAAFGRRVGAGLLRRAAYRANRSAVLPDGVRKALVNVNTGLADAIGVEPPIADE